ncbi:hypothetical protein [Bradyrhizobium roseum]|uniref:hypothetical protein n=1 Tax=Bradyrhizobium roseum TaxID=3056648 RepID=UPI0026332C0A|nr:hypothetical protein [Bradyrhizobium roseus]WKA30069.1 hypothetical protein QUH67_07820 [Bradyrhizobium roseus]
MKDFKDAVERSSTSSTSSQQSPGSSNSNPIMLAGRPPINLANPTGKGIPLYQSQGAGNTNAQKAAPARPGTPIDVAQMETLNSRVQSFNVKRSPVDHQQLKDAQQHFQAATDALKAGDYKKAEAELNTLGFPLPKGGGQLGDAARTSAILLGTPVHGRKDGGWQAGTMSEATQQAMKDMNGFAANAKMINRLASAPGGVSNPPTEAQVTQYMRDLANPPKGRPQPTSQQVMQAAGDITGGMIMHYSAAGRQDPIYDGNPTPRAFYKDRAGRTHEFPSLADAKTAATAARAHRSPDAPSGRINQMIARSPDQWSDVTSQGAPRAGRYIGDCESKVYMQTRLLTSAGFTSVGSINVQRPDGIGHMLGVFKAPDGTTWVTSNEDFRQVSPSNAKAGVTQADLDATVHQMTGEVYHTRDLRAYTFSSAATANLPTTGDPAVGSIRRSSEMGMMRRTEVLIPPPPPPPAQSQAVPGNGSGGPTHP